MEWVLGADLSKEFSDKMTLVNYKTHYQSIISIFLMINYYNKIRVPHP